MENSLIHNESAQQSKFKETEVFSGDTPDIELLRQSLLLSEDNNDPRSMNYERTLARPIIRWRLIAIQTIVILGCLISMFALTSYWTDLYWLALLNVGLFILA